MTENRRIVLNTLAAYGRSLITLPINLLSTRWVLEGLGQTDMGIYNVVGGVVFFITFINAILSGAASRFYAFSIGRGKSLSNSEAQEDMQRWFNTTLSIHILLPIILLIGYPVASYAVRHWLTIPPDRLDAAIWVLRCSFAIAFFSFINVPYSALFSAHQLIAELSLYTLLVAICQFFVAMAISYLPCDHLIGYALINAGVSIGLMIALNIAARLKFDAARISLRLMYDIGRLKELMAFVLWKLLGASAYVLRGQGSAVLLNVNFGPTTNAAFSIGNQLSGQAASFSQSLINALTPALTTASGARDRERTMSLAFQSCKFASLLVLLFGIPLILEIDEVLMLWLKNPPKESAFFCICMISDFFFQKLTLGHYLLITANGEIGAWQRWESFAYILTLPIGWGLIHLGVNAFAVGMAYVIGRIFVCGGQIYYAHKIGGMGIFRWIKDVFIPVVLTAVLTGLIGWGVVLTLDRSFMRLVITTGICTVVLIAIALKMVLSEDERCYLANFSGRVLRKVRRGC